MTTTKKPLLLDTCVLIDHQRGRSPAAKELIRRAALGSLNAGVSLITEFELYAGVRDKVDDKEVRLLLASLRIFVFNRKIMRRAGELYLPFCRNRSNAVMIPDILIAATAEYYQATIVTSNIKHFEQLPLRNIEITTPSQN